MMMHDSGGNDVRPQTVATSEASRDVVLGRLLVVAVMLVGLAACSKSESEPLVSGSTIPVTTGRAATTEAVTTTSTSTATATTTDVPLSGQPSVVTATPTPGMPPVPTDAQWAAHIKALQVRVKAMYADPPNADVTSLCVVGSECDARYSTQIDDMVNKKWHTENDSPSEVVSIDKVVDVAATSNGSIAPGTEYEISYSSRLGDMSNAVVVDADGNVVYRLTAAEGTPEVYPATRLLMWYPSDQELPWRYID